MAYEMVMPYHLHMPSYFLETFTEYPYLVVFGLFELIYILISDFPCQIHIKNEVLQICHLEM